MEILIYVANGLYLASYFMKDILRLRILTVVAACCLVAYFYIRPEPEMTIVGWNLFFVALNVVQISRIIWSGTPKPRVIEEDVPTNKLARMHSFWREPLSRRQSYRPNFLSSSQYIAQTQATRQPT